MNKMFLKVPSDRIERILFSIALVEGVSGNSVNKDEIIQAFKEEGIELNDDIKEKLMKEFPKIKL